MALSAQLSGLVIPKPTSMVTEFTYYEKTTAPRVERILCQQFDLFDVSHQQNSIKTNTQRLKQHATKAFADILVNDLPSNLIDPLNLLKKNVHLVG